MPKRILTGKVVKKSGDKTISVLVSSQTTHPVYKKIIRVSQVADNSGARLISCIKVIGGSKRRYARIGDIIVVSVKDAIPRSKVKKGEVQRAIIVRTKKPLIREDGTSIKFDSNAAVLLDKQNEPIGTRIFGPVTRELRKRNMMKIVSLAPEVL